MTKSSVHREYKVVTIRFRRWTRASYASFVGLDKNVTIGTIAVSIADRLLLKSSSSKSVNVGGSHLPLMQRSMSEVLSIES
ncbi:MAG: hypothetical protein SNH79_07720 [Rikenellaceae bacterium]